MTPDETGRRDDAWGWVMLTAMYGSAVAWLAMAALFFLAREQAELAIVPALGFALIGVVPLLGHAAGCVAATLVWDWHPALSGMFFFGFVVPLLPLWLRRRNAQLSPTRSMTP